MTHPVSFVPTMPVYELKEGIWAQVDPVTVLPGDTLMTVTGQEKMTLSIIVDELDISGVFIGQTAQVQVEVLRDRVFPAEVTSVGRSGSNSGGSSKFTVTLIVLVYI